MFKKRHPTVGSRPGTLVISSDALPPVINLMRYSSQGPAIERRIENATELNEPFPEQTVTWIDIQGFGDHDVMKLIGERFGLHPLMLEDVINVPHRPKAEVYNDQLLLIINMILTNEETIVEIEQVSIVLGKNYVITFQDRPGDVLDPIRNRIRLETAPIRQHQADFLAYAIADTIVDAYYPALELLGDKLEDLEEEVVASPTTKLLHELNRLKNRLVNFRRAVWPQREAINSLIRDHHLLVSEPVRIHFRDVYDHCVQTSEVVEMYRDMVTGMLNTYLTSIANRTNDVMKVLTIVATIFIPLTFIAGIYGMNFQHMPELSTRWGYPIVWVVMLLIAGGMLYFFRKQGWLGGDGDED
ncbi:MAG: magnesium/cobalt transporter CorA [Planctomycetaceae bacterium]|nr:magnesium/cobalt transporter CorA [Planctomycetaceae bacterium]